MNQTWSIARKDTLEIVRDRRWLGTAIIVTLMSLAALFLAHQRVAGYEQDRLIAEAQDRKTWLNQGARNPHGAAHFNTWAFRPLTPAALLDPGVSAHSGSAIWLEAHNQNPATARAAEDRAGSLDLGAFSISWVLQVVVPLLVFSVAAGLVARDRERGTLRLMLAAGANARSIPLQKAIALGGMTLLAATPLLAAAAATFAMAPAPADMDQFQRLLLWIGAHAVYLAIMALVAVAVSARAKRVDSALVTLVAIWLLAVPLAPRLAASVAEVVAPMTTAQTFWRGVAADLGEAHVFDPEDPAAKALEKRVLAQYGVSQISDLPVSYAGIQLDEAEKHGNTVFDRHYSALNAQADRQRAIMRFAAVLSPLIALQNVSAGVAGTDAIHQRDFATRAESHRRLTVAQLNADMIANAAGKDFDYIASPQLWASVPAFTYDPPSWTTLATAWLPDAAILLGWMLAAWVFVVNAGQAMARSDV